MFGVIDCLSQSHDWRLVLVAMLVCVVGSVATFHLLSKTIGEPNRAARRLWFALTTVAAASSVWAAHLIAMLGYKPGVAVGFDIDRTSLSFAIAIMFDCAAFMTALISSRVPVRLVAGTMLGCSTVLMHYTGISAMQLNGIVVWDTARVVASIVLSSGLAAASVVLAGDCRTANQRAIGAALFAISVAMLHFTGMSAITLFPDPSVVLTSGLLSGEKMGYLIAAVTLLLLLSGLAAWQIDRRAKRESDLRLRFMARHDMLTNLPNRTYFQEAVERVLAAPETGDRHAAVLCLDLDGFKEVNDIFGHATGDALLIEVADRLRHLSGGRLVAARLGGDEFAVLAPGYGTVGTADWLARQVLEALTRPFMIEGSAVDVGCSIGVALFPQDGTSYEMLLTRADIALSRSKTDGRGVFRFYESAMDDVVRRRRRLGQDIKRGIPRGEFYLEYQPQFDFKRDRVSGFEALVRWKHPVDGPLTPVNFIAIAEETGAILPLGQWVLEEACREAARWPAPLNIAVNVSVAQFRQSGLDAVIGAALTGSGLAPERLEIEVTESLFLDRHPRILTTLNAIKAMGVRVSIDDFGTGFSSLATLQAFPFDKIKVDRSFTAQIGAVQKGTAIVEAIVRLGENLGMRVVAEGVETDHQMQFLRDLNCSEFQGFLLGRPEPICHYDDLIQVLQGRRFGNVVALRSA